MLLFFSISGVPILGVAELITSQIDWGIATSTHTDEVSSDELASEPLSSETLSSETLSSETLPSEVELQLKKVENLKGFTDGSHPRIIVIKSMITERGLSKDSDLAPRNTESIPFFALRWVSDVDDAVLDIDDPQLLQRYALAVLCYSQTTQASARDHSSGELSESQSPCFNGWMTQKTNICDWNGITCSDDDSRTILKLELTGMNVKGTIPMELRALSDLELLDLSENEITGTIPALYHKNIGFQQLTSLHLEENQLHGQLPSDFQYANKLEDIYLGNNKLTGELPNGIYGLNRLANFNVRNNLLHGQLPINMQSLINLQSLELERNSFSGLLPAELSSLTKLTALILSHNNFEGQIPYDYGSLVNLEHFRANDNALNGTIPTELGNLIHLKELFLDNNAFTGSLPSQLGVLNSAGTFDFVLYVDGCSE